MYRLRIGLLACALFAAALLSACGSSSKSSSATNSASATSPAASTPTSSATSPKATGAAFKLGMICSCSGPQASALAPLGKIASAWASSVNAGGGINGHPVDLIVKDDGSNPGTSLQDVKTLVADDHVMAIVGDSSLVDTVWASYVAKQGIPVVGGISVEAPFLSNPDFYPSGTQVLVQADALAALAKKAGKTRIGLPYCAESPICAENVPVITSTSKLNGLKPPVPVKIAAAAPSYTAPCLQLKSAGADVLFLADNATIDQRFYTACAEQGYKVPQVNSVTASAASWLSDPNFSGILLAATNANPFDPSLPAVKAFQTAVNKYAPGVLSNKQITFNAIYPWVGGKLFEAAAKAGKLTPSSTPADVKKGLDALKGETLGGLSAPLTFTSGKPTFVPCYFSESIKGGKFVSLAGDKPTCLAPAAATALAKAAAG